MFASLRRPVVPVAALAGLAACITLAADGPVDPLLKLRADWRAQVMKDTKALRDEYADNLAKLEKELAAGGDYAGAVQARRERLRIAESAAAPEKTAPPKPAELVEGAPIELKIQAASLTGGVNLSSDSGALIGWEAEGAAARWSLPAGLKGGGYDVELTWSCAPNAGGDVVFKEDRYTLRRSVKPTAGWEDFRRRSSARCASWPTAAFWKFPPPQ